MFPGVIVNVRRFGVRSESWSKFYSIFLPLSFSFLYKQHETNWSVAHTLAIHKI